MERVKFEMKVKGGKLAREHVFNVDMDFTDISREVLLEWARQNRVIALQSQIRIRGEEWAAAQGGRIEVRADELLGRGPSKRVTVQVDASNMADVVGHMTEEQKAALRAMLGA